MGLEFRCEDVGAVCGAKIKAESEAELLEKIASHADTEHGVPELSDTLVEFAKTKVRQT